MRIVLCTALEESRVVWMLCCLVLQLLLSLVWRVVQAWCPSPAKGLVQWVDKVYATSGDLCASTCSCCSSFCV